MISLKKTKKNAKKLLAALLAALMVMPFIPAEILLASPQAPVTDLRLYLKPTEEHSYRFGLQWSLPDPDNISYPITNQNPIDYVENSRKRTSYTIIQKDLATGEEEEISTNDLENGKIDPRELFDTEYETENLKSGNLYLYRVDASHTGYTPSSNPNYPAIPHTATAKGNGVVLLTDIKVEAEIKGETIEVNWDFTQNPAESGKSSFFVGYQIYFSAVGADAAISQGINYITFPVWIDDPDLELLDDKYSYTFAPTLDIGSVYAVKVEPLYSVDGSKTRAFELRKSSDAQTIKIGNENCVLIYHPYNDFFSRRDNLRVKPVLEKPIEIEGDKLLLKWRPDYGPGSVVTRIEILSSATPDFENEKLVVRLHPTYFNNYSEYPILRPTERTYYKIRVYYDYIDINGNPQSYIESEYREYNPGVVSFAPTDPTIIQADDYGSEPISIDLTWEALYRNPVSPDDEYQPDKNVEYDVWITDNIDDLNNLENLLSGANELPSGIQRTASALNPNLDLEETTIDGVNAYVYSFNHYLKHASNPEQYEFEENHIYYFVVRVTRLSSEGESAIAYYAHYVPPRGPLETNPLSMSKPPLRIKTQNGVEIIDKESITIEWDTLWWEIYDTESKTWHSEIGVKDDKLVFGNDITGDVRSSGKVLLLTSQDYNTRDKVIEALVAIGLPTDEADKIAHREMNISDTEPRIHVVTKEYLESQGGYEAYLQTLLDIEKQAGVTQEEIDNIWHEITDPISEGASGTRFSYKVTETHAPEAGPLSENTPYIIIFRPFISSNKIEDMMALIPSYVLGTTLADRPEPEIVPTVPILIGVSSNDTSITVKWKYDDMLTYELAYSELASELEAGGIIIPEDILMQGVDTTIENGYMYYTVTGLFPDTIYYLRIRSIASKPSLWWSNMISMKTEDITAPMKPNGLGPAYVGNLDIINKENNLELVPIDSNYMVIQWNNIYDVELTQATSGSAEILAGSGVDAPLVLFSDLVDNTTYYVRVKTRKIVTKNGTENTLSYHYIVQLSTTEDFLEYVECIVPPINESAQGQRTKSKDSEWTDAFVVRTSPPEGGYDSELLDNMHPIPPQDYEVSYDSDTDTLTVRFRSTGKDADGNNDNLSDQRFISKLIADKTYNYVLDVTSYNNKVVKNRNIEFPYSIIKAFDERKINLTVRAGNFSVTLPHGFTKTTMVNALSDLGTSSKVNISLTGSPQGTPSLTKRENIHATSQKLSISVATPKATTPIINAAQPLSVSFKLTNRYTALDQNIGGYIYGVDDAEWMRQKTAYDTITGRINFSTASVASYSAISIAPPEQTASDQNADQAMIAVQSLMNIQDVNYYFPEAQISVSQLNKLISAIAKNDLDVSINAPLTDAEKTSLTKAGLMLSGNKTVSRENAVFALIKLYELKTKSQISNVTPLESTAFTDIASSSPANHQSLLKAADLGFFDNDEFARPQDAITLSETLQMLDIIIQDAGL